MTGGPVRAIGDGRSGAPCWIIDNRSPHRAPAVRERLEAAGLGPIVLPRCAPNLNPIEAVRTMKADPRTAGSAT